MARFISKLLFCLGGFFVGSVFLDWLFWGEGVISNKNSVYCSALFASVLLKPDV